MKNLKIGIMGTGRGKSVIKDFLLNGFDIVAVCESNPERLKADFGVEFDKSVKIYSDFDEFINHDMDAVFLANYFHEHAPYAIKCFEKGIHVYSECISNGTMAEGVELIRAFEKSNSIYMLAENYPQMKFNREIKRVCDGGTLGKILYAEGEYNHPGNVLDTNFAKLYKYFRNHWRHLLPRSYYITHSLGPIMAATGATPVRVTSFNTAAPFDENLPSACCNIDRAAIVTTQNDDGSVFKLTGCSGFGAHGNSYRVCGTKGQIENLRGMGEKIMLRYNDWEIPEGMEEVNLYEPEWNDKDEEIIAKSGHGGGDYLTIRMFAQCIRENKQPPHPFDIYSAINMSSVAILAHRSMLNNGQPYDIPDFSKEECRKEYENDRLTPFYGSDGSEPNIPCCSVRDYKPSEKQLELYDKQIES